VTGRHNLLTAVFTLTEAHLGRHHAKVHFYQQHSTRALV